MRVPSLLVPARWSILARRCVLHLARLSWNQWRPGLLWLAGLGLLDQVWLRWLRAHAPSSSTAACAMKLAVGQGPSFCVAWWAATLHLALLVLCFGLCVFTTVRRARRP